MAYKSVRVTPDVWIRLNPNGDAIKYIGITYKITEAGVMPCWSRPYPSGIFQRRENINLPLGTMNYYNKRIKLGNSYILFKYLI